MRSGLGGRFLRAGIFSALVLVMVVSLQAFDKSRTQEEKYDRLYFPSGKFLVESSVGFREAHADYLWFRFIQYYGAFAKGLNNFRHFELLVNGITTLDPNFVEAYHFASLVTWSDLGKPYKSIDILKRGILNNPDTARLPFQIGLIYFVVDGDYARSAFWYNQAASCSDATDLERRFAAFSKYKSGDQLGSLSLWENLYQNSDQPGMQLLAVKMINTIKEKMKPQGQHQPGTGF
ncbi:MAG: hypothetical protein GY780_14540 [bacterium]|nr:hypothetical protein [bacterium]